MKSLVQYLLYPVIVIGFGFAGIQFGATYPGLAGYIAMACVLMLAIAFTFLAEFYIPYNEEWNQHSVFKDRFRDTIHALVNESSIVLAILAIPTLTSFLPWQIWPEEWPFIIQLILALLVIDFGITLAHYFSHRINFLWRFHAVHHSVKRMYGFNGLMKHPIHQAIEITAGVFPLLLINLPVPVAKAAAFLVALQLLMQHTNADIRLGFFRSVIAAAEGHRFHHQKEPAIGDVNFGLFTLLWDHLLGTFSYKERMPLRTDELGIGDQPNYVQDYFGQLTAPFKRE